MDDRTWSVELVGDQGQNLFRDEVTDFDIDGTHLGGHKDDSPSALPK